MVSLLVLKMNCSVVLVTGKAGCGKSAVMDYLQSKGKIVLKTDDIVKELYKKDYLLKNRIKDIYGSEVCSNEVNFKKLAEKLFDETLLSKRTEFMKVINWSLSTEISNKISNIEEIVYIEAAPLLEIGQFIHLMNIKDVFIVECKDELISERLKVRKYPDGYWDKVSKFQNIKNIFGYDNVKNYLHVEYIDNSRTLEELHKRMDELI